PVRKKGTSPLAHSAFENARHVVGMKSRAADKRDSARLAFFVGVTRQHDRFVRNVNSNHVETKFDKVKRIAAVSAAPIDDFHALRSSRIAGQNRIGEDLSRGTW